MSFEPVSQDDNETVIQSRPRKVKYCQLIGNCFVVNVTSNFKLVIGPHWPGVLVAYTTLIAGTLLFFKVIELSSTNGRTMLTTILEYNAYVMFSLTAIFLFLTSILDPGIVVNDRTSHGTDIEMVDNKCLHNSSDPICEICDICQLKSKRISHCFDCNVCMEQIDHHCPWMVSYFSVRM